MLISEMIEKLNLELGDKIEWETLRGWGEDARKVTIQGVYLGHDKTTLYVALDRQNWNNTGVMGRPMPWEPMKITLHRNPALTETIRKVEN